MFEQWSLWTKVESANHKLGAAWLRFQLAKVTIIVHMITYALFDQMSTKKEIHKRTWLY